MKYTINHITEGEDEVILNYLERTEEVDRIIAFLKNDGKRIIGWQEKEQVAVKPADILYIESVDGRTYVYTAEKVCRVYYTLTEMESVLGDVNFFRCSKAMIMNIDYVVNLRSLSSNRIDATMQNGEHILISRTYATDFRKRIKGER